MDIDKFSIDIFVAKVQLLTKYQRPYFMK